MRRCRHQWSALGAKYTPSSDWNGRGVPIEVVRELSLGVTVVTLRCRRCGDIAFRRTSGQTVDVA